MTERNGPAKLKDVAEAAGVSISTVSRVFSNPERLSPATVQHVREVAQRLRYAPNVVARALITGVAANIGLVVPDITNPYMTRLLKAAQGRSRASNVGLLVADTDDSAEIERQVAEQLARQARGLILCAPRMSASHIRDLASMVPLVIINRVVDGVPAVYTDSRQALREFVDELVGLGHRRFAYLPGPTRSWANRQRQQAIGQRAARHGAELVVLEPTAATYEDGIGAASAVADAGVTAVLAFDDVLASGLMEGLRRAGLTVPGDVSVVGHDDVLAELTRPGLATVRAQAERVGRLAAERLLDPDGEVERTESMAIHAETVRRDSIAPPSTRHVSS
ncbi:LacI family DNA-binding transcriptional regulator [Myceligenerans pegani]|uniref:LacI family DNA-binding transcriptional regulator n=1 Tax=Myceligenerans pegani TaxID=2776917 RepID=A0ABR9MYW5_9MICO|nr:LacI family DNA-binding transcriptional regulator [Myceligenerans sp. TRM 65318]MBE1876582.1 LacI family DNA-binding transcriptional regulator [Myceligenerans sp. TRM 65318]MBE3018853.1 LacI family DNA-binding transcriptional regulator [Myceligenerans sp. TRM 65318]